MARTRQTTTHTTFTPSAALVAADAGTLFRVLADCVPVPGGVLLTPPDIAGLAQAAIGRWPRLDSGTAARQIGAYLAPARVGGTARILYDVQRDPLVAILDWLARNAHMPTETL